MVFKLFVIFGLFAYCDCCSPLDTVWDSWGSCSASCGGGTRHRSGHVCVWHTHKSESGSCNEFCYNGVSYSGGCHCPAWRTDRCCGTCRHIYIAHCKSGQQQCGGSPDSIRCTDCEDPYYSAGYGKGCAACPAITNCEHRHCTAPSNVTCVRCFDDRMFFQRTHHDTHCERMCAWNNHYCWPGECSNNLISSCKCADGFHAVMSSTETSCQLMPTNSPSIETCESMIYGSNGEIKRAESSSSSTACAFLMDFYGNYQPKLLKFDLLITFQVNIISSLKIPAFIHESNFGVTDVTLTVKKESVQGTKTSLQNYQIQTDKSDGFNAVSTFASKMNISLNDGLKLSNGEWLCLIYEAKGGGYLKSYDLRQPVRVPSSPVPYTKTTTTRQLCYRFDSAKPQHCAASGQCSYEPLQILKKITRSPVIYIRFEGWYDPVPVGGNSTRASSIKSYTISLHEVFASKHYLRVDTRLLHTVMTNNSNDIIKLTLSSCVPQLYAIYLEVADFADNVRKSRRFVFYDNSSQIDTMAGKSFTINSASQLTNYQWQTDNKSVCLNWTDYFYNKNYFEKPPVTTLEPDPFGIQGVYEQSEGVLPITTVSNTHGIVNFEISWALNHGNFSSEHTVTYQTFCQNLNTVDGDSVTFKVEATDIVNNTLVESRTVHFDQSEPVIRHLGLTANGGHMGNGSFVCNSTDLSKMVFQLDALDIHSGIRNIEWTLDVSNSGQILANDRIGVGEISYSQCKATTSCYCPSVGKCESFRHTISLSKLADEGTNIGENNKSYILTVKVTNHALLSSQLNADILVYAADLLITNDRTAVISGIVVGGVGGAVVLVATAIAFIYVLRRKNSGSSSTSNDHIGPYDNFQRRELEHVYEATKKEDAVELQDHNFANSDDKPCYATQNEMPEPEYETVNSGGDGRIPDSRFENIGYQLSISDIQVNSEHNDNMECRVYENLKIDIEPDTSSTSVR